MRIQKFKTRYRITLTIAQYKCLEDMLYLLDYDIDPDQVLEKQSKFAHKFNSTKIEEGK